MRKMTKIEIITRPGKLEDLKEAMNAIGVTGMDRFSSLRLWFTKRPHRSLPWTGIFH